jgi:hypothetical protein
MRRDPIEVAVGDGHHGIAGPATLSGTRLVRRRVGGEVLRIEEIAGRLTRRRGPIESRVALSSDQPFGLGDLVLLNFHPHGHDRRRAAFLDRAEKARLSTDRIEITPLKFAERGNGLPHSGAGTHDHGVFRLTKTGK